jgi:hypothetical protein
MRYSSVHVCLPRGSVDVGDTNTGEIITETRKSETSGLHSIGHFKGITIQEKRRLSDAHSKIIL